MSITKLCKSCNKRKHREAFPLDQWGRVDIRACLACAKRCNVVGCTRTDRITRGFCGLHYQRWLNTGEVGAAAPLRRRDKTRKRRKGRDVGYVGAHHRVRALRGKASDYPCEHKCGKRAEDWAYDHSDPNELVATGGQLDGLAYSSTPDHYVPLCKLCHKAFDRVAV